MKKISGVFLFFTFCQLCFTGCKKGEEDPAISLLSRKTRVTGDWHLTKGTASITSLASRGGYNSYYMLDGTSYTRNETPSGGQLTVYLGKYSLKTVFNKDGSFALEENKNGLNLIASGTWNFTSGVGKFKNKDGLIIRITSVTSDETDGHLFNQYSTEFTYKIVELKNKEMKLECSNPVYISSNGSKFSVQNSYTLIQ